MASEYGESVAFTCAYAGNFRELASLLRKNGRDSVELLEEIQELLAVGEEIFADIEGKKAVLARYLRRCGHSVSGHTIPVSVPELADTLDCMADWLAEHIRRQEWIDAGENGGWFNSYYDNHQRPLESMGESGARMMLTGQVFAIMSGVATGEQTRSITRSAGRWLYRKEIGGYRLNTDFRELKLDMGRMFGFAYGEKENGAVFSHMTVMYANALYRRGFVREGYKALQTLADTALDFQTSKIFPGIPEYFNADGRGMYHYLTGAASWYMLTVITEVFGVHGEKGDLAIAPKLMREQFDRSGAAAIELVFAGKSFRVTMVNLTGKDYGAYHIGKAYLSGLSPSSISRLPVEDGKALLRREVIDCLPELGNSIMVELM